MVSNSSATRDEQSRSSSGGGGKLGGRLAFFTNAAGSQRSTPYSSPQTPPPSINREHPPSSQSTAANRVTLDPNIIKGHARKDLLREAFFPDWKDDASKGDLADPDEMQKRDPLGTQIWKLYSKTKTQLPNQERMENLTWRMMAMNLKRKEREQARYVVEGSLFGLHTSGDNVLLLTDCTRLNQQAIRAPSGIAKLRKSHDETNNAQDDPMNIDDFIFPGSTASPAGISPSPPLGKGPAPSTAMASAIPIKTKKNVQEQSRPDFPPSAPPQDRSRSNEFGYVQRRVRKTSIDETRVRKQYEKHMDGWVDWQNVM